MTFGITSCGWRSAARAERRRRVAPADDAYVLAFERSRRNSELLQFLPNRSDNAAMLVTVRSRRASTGMHSLQNACTANTVRTRRRAATQW